MAGRNVSFAMRAGAVFASVALVFGLVPTQALAESMIELNGESAEYGSDGDIAVQGYDQIVVENTDEIVVESTTTYDTSYTTYDSTSTEGSDGIVVQGGNSYEDYAMSAYGGYANDDGSGLLVAQADIVKHTVMFSANGGTASPSSQQVEDGQKVTTPTTPQRAGWDFAGWYRTSTPTATDTPVDLANEPIMSDETFYAGWKAQLTVKVYDRVGKQYGVGGKVTVDGGSASAEVKKDVFDGTKVTLGAEADSNYRLVGWSTDENDPAARIAGSSAGYELTFGDKTKTVVAVFGELVTINFDINGGTPGAQWVDSRQVDYGSSIAYGTVPDTIDPAFATAPKGSKFAGLEFNVAGTVRRYECGKNVDPLSITGATTVKYLWEMDLATVTFVDDDDSVLMPATQYPVGTPSADIARPVDPQKADTAQYTFTFIGWSPQVNDVTGDVTYKADYSKATRTYTIRFVNESGVLLQSGQVAYGVTPEYRGMTPVKASSAKSDYTFAGWSPSVTAVTGDATYTATFTESPRAVKLTFQLNGGTLEGDSVRHVVDSNVGSSYTLPTPTRDGFVFQYWWAGMDKHYSGEAWNVSGNQLFLAIWRAVGGGSGSTIDTGGSGSGDGDTTTVYSTSERTATPSTSTVSSISGTSGNTTGTTTTVTPSGSTSGTASSVRTTTGTTTGTTSKIGSTTSTSTKSTVGSTSKTTLSKTADPQAEQLVIEMLFAVAGVMLIAGGFELTRRRSLR